MRDKIIYLIILLAITFTALSPAIFNGFTNWDDQIMITQNAKITGLGSENIKIFFTTPHERLYHPLVLISYAIDYKLGGLNPLIFHLTNLVLHLLTTVMVFWFIYLLTGKVMNSFIVALLFGIHPMHVESVAWLAERKDVLYAFFFMASLAAYLIYKKTGEMRFSRLTLFLFVCSLLSKPMALTLPFILILIDYYLDKKMDAGAILGKWIYYILAAVFGAVMVWAHYYSQAYDPVASLSLLNRSLFASYGIVFYMIKMIVPLGLSNYYPMPAGIEGMLSMKYLVSPLLLFIVMATAVFSLRYTKKVFFGVMYFLIVLAPVSQIVPVGLGILADRYTYISYIGLFFIVSEGIAWLYQGKPKYKLLISSVLIAAALGLSWLSFERALVWRDSMSLWNDVIKKYPGAPIAYYNRGEEYFLVRRDYGRATIDFTRAIELDQKYTSAYINRGLIKYFSGQIDASIVDYDKALSINPRIGEAYGNRGNSYHVKGERGKALKDYFMAVKFKPDYPEAFYNRGNLYVEMGRMDEAYSDYLNAIRLKPDYPEAYNNLGNAYFRAGELDKAFDAFDRAISLAPGYADAYYNRAVVLAAGKRYAFAYDDAQRAASLGYRIHPDFIKRLRVMSGK